MNPSKAAPTLEQVLKRPTPAHIAIIMDGNGRWAERRGLPRLMGHRAGRRAVREVVEASVELGIKVLTLYTFSLENWDRGAREVSGLMRILEQVLREEREELKRNNVQLRTIGRVDLLPERSRKILESTRSYLSGNDGLVLVLALSYGGRAEIVDAVRRILEQDRERRIAPAAIDEDFFAGMLDTDGLPDPDLLIRTSGELRVSNFLLWQLAYAEFWVTDVLWPDFRRKHLFQAVYDFQRRSRRFGRTR
ncbi:MAG: isoprenyl transferase [Candidatus Eisenbacteria bacterium]|uniref:Isoprenyl transferase n=1 Tax=Eiseniibacteriota bacterium TaxID=2212470 RepID=A0A538SW40_UNCEI|nr:MAG: isoprenyl transferase [Candidatus Eisenbacteria bacterium]TMQ61546.1 MAG: isoprenyl transferase [Candidatus Eisenbacteria bacterium]